MTPSAQKVHHLPSTAAGMANQQSRKGGGYVTDGEMTEVEVSSHRCSMYWSLTMGFGKGGARVVFGPSQILEQQKEVCFQQKHYQGLRQMLLTLSWNLCS